MHSFAIASVYPRSIAWLIRLDEWDRFETIINYNCAMIGGYFNIVVPLTDQDFIPEHYQRFLVDYDPDLIVLAPSMTANQLDTLSVRLHPFGIIPWESVSQIASLDPLALYPWSGGTGINATLGPNITNNIQGTAIVAVADDAYPDTSQLALVACGDVEPRKHTPLERAGHREEFLMNIPPYKNDKRIGAHIRGIVKFAPTPNRYQLALSLSDEHRFPLSGTFKILETCSNLHYLPSSYSTFISLTASYEHEYQRRYVLVLVVSEHFGLEEAAVFWNLRANGYGVAWLSFSEIENNIDEVIRWCSNDRLSLRLIKSGVTFSSSSNNVARLQTIVDKLESKRSQVSPTYNCVPYDALLAYKYNRPYVKQNHVIVAKDESRRTFIPKLLKERIPEIYTVTLEKDDLMFPQDSTLVRDRISSATITASTPIWKDGEQVILPGMEIPQFRITKDRYIKVQISTEQPIDFKIPPPEQIVETLFAAAGFSRIERSSAAQYHMSFINRVGSLDAAAHYLATPSYRKLLELLSDNSDNSKIGWCLSHPDKRRVLHHLHILEALEKEIEPQTRNYFDWLSDQLPLEVVDLLEKGILERGFKLVCNSCSFNSWYPAEYIGQTFKCTSCYQTQVYKSNPLWLYKLAEVVFKGFENNMQVPLLSLDYLRRKSKYHFEWVPDSDVYWLESNKEHHKNIDLLCLCDGKLFIGEAKSNDEIEPGQFSFYEGLCKHVTVDGVIFATSNSQWGRGTRQRIEGLKTWFRGEVLVLTEKDLYSNTSIT